MIAIQCYNMQCLEEFNMIRKMVTAKSIIMHITNKKHFHHSSFLRTTTMTKSKHTCRCIIMITLMQPSWLVGLLRKRRFSRYSRGFSHHRFIRQMKIRMMQNRWNLTISFANSQVWNQIKAQIMKTKMAKWESSAYYKRNHSWTTTNSKTRIWI